MATLGSVVGVPPAPNGEYWATGWVRFEAFDQAASGYANGTFRANYPFEGVLNVSGTAFVSKANQALQVPMKTSSGDDAPNLVMTGQLVSNQGSIRNIYGFGPILASQVSPSVQWNINTAMLGGGGYSGPYVLYAQDVGVTVKGLTGVRKTVTFTTGSLADQAATTFELNLGRMVRILRYQFDRACRFRMYPTAAIRTLDASRPSAQDAAANSPAYCDVVSSASVLDIISPNPPLVSNFDNPTVATLYCALQNLSGGASPVSVTLTYIVEEA